MIGHLGSFLVKSDFEIREFSYNFKFEISAVGSLFISFPFTSEINFLKARSNSLFATPTSFLPASGISCFSTATNGCTVSGFCVVVQNPFDVTLYEPV